MNKVLFISESAVYGNTLRNMLRGQFEIEMRRYDEIDNINDFDIVLYDHKDDLNDSNHKMVTLREKCGFVDIPIIIATNNAQAIDAKIIEQNGATGVLFKPFDSKLIQPYLVNCLKPVGVKNNIDVNLLNPFVEGTIHVIEKMMNTEVSRKALFLKRNYTMFGDISGTMDISGNLEGTVAVTFRTELALELVAKMLGYDPADISTDDIHEGVKELINVISGNAKKLISETSYKFEIDLPKLALGYGNKINHEAGSPFYIILFETLGQDFAIQLCVVPNVTDDSTSQPMEAALATK